ncbi:alpha/beta hydrolase [Gulosibacter chungangensis]|uniref:Alpha/beta hydrolase n=2 Tax=Gulosibacter chungangensis TaxID=979746 RepID=A0A7J5BFF9_9MICO|nr:alpha/beta hydrolase [Gulosibacter chungangensis]
MPVSARFYTPGMDTSNDGFEVDYVEHILRIEGVDVHVYEWATGRSPKGVVHVSHGAGDHARRYQRLANALRDAGYAVVAADMLGHGRTGVGSWGLSNLGPGGMPAARRMLRETVRWARGRYPGIPLIEAGHSWGSLLGQQLFWNEPEIFDAIVWTGTTLALPGLVNPGDYNAKWAGDGHGMSWLSRDPAEVQAMIDDPYGFDIADSSVWTPLGAVQLLTAPPAPRCGRAARVPILVMTGTEDPLGYGVRGPRALAWSLRHITRMRDVTFRIYPESRHEVYNELDRNEVTAELLEWLRWHFEAPATR